MRLIKIAVVMIGVAAVFAIGNAMFNPEPWAFGVMFLLALFFVVVA